MEQVYHTQDTSRLAFSRSSLEISSHHSTVNVYKSSPEQGYSFSFYQAEKIKINVKSTNVSYAIVNLLSVCLLFYIVFCSSLFILISTYLIGLEIFHNTKKILIFQFFITQKILIFQTMVFPLLVHKIFFCDNHNEVDIIIGIIQFHFH